MKALYSQQFFQDPKVVLKKVPGTRNPADVFTQALSGKELQKHYPALGLTVFGSRLTEYEKAEVNMIREGTRDEMWELRRNLYGIPVWVGTTTSKARALPRSS